MMFRPTGVNKILSLPQLRSQYCRLCDSYGDHFLCHHYQISMGGIARAKKIRIYQRANCRQNTAGSSSSDKQINQILCSGCLCRTYATQSLERRTESKRKFPQIVDPVNPFCHGYRRGSVAVQAGRPLLIPSPWMLVALSLSLTLLLRPVVPAMPETLSLRELSMLVRMLLELDRLLARRASSGS